MKINIDTKWIKSIRNLDDSARLSLYDSIFDYVSGEDVTLKGEVKIAFDMIKPMLDTNRTKPRQKKLLEVDEFRSEKLLKLDEWMQRHVPYIANNLNPLSQKEFEKLLSEYGIRAMCETMEQIENRKDLRKTYTSLYRTLLNWLKNGYTYGNHD
ncbi:MAG: hypothetical protein J6Q61_09310 [Bacteroidales bacterium]|nr:hypothetical protein [Bacteroidales bacterium]